MNDDEVKESLRQQFPDWKPKSGEGGLRELGPSTPMPSRSAGTPARKHKYAADAIAADCGELAAMPAESGRNSELNRIAFKLFRFSHWSWIDEQTVYQSLRQAYIACGGLKDHGEGQWHSTIKGARDNSRRLPEPEVDWHEFEPNVTIVASIDGHYFDENDYPVEADEAEAAMLAAQQEIHRGKVSARAYEYRISDEAKRMFNSQRAAEQNQQRPGVELLTDMLLVPDEDANYRINELLPTGGRALLAAQYKAGKTSLIANLIRSLADGSPFLGRFDIQPTDRVTLIDTELDKRMLRRWLREVGIVKTDKVTTLSLRGKLSTFDLLDDDVRAYWARQIQGSDFIILDCLRPCLDALGLDENRDAGTFLVAFDELVAESGCSDAVMVHHMGHQNGESGDKERSRGDSRLLDWPDVLWKIVKNNEDENDDSRYFSAMGRDVNVEESRLLWNAQDRSLFIRGGSRTDVSAANAIPDVMDYLAKPECSAGVGQNAIERAMKPFGHGRNRVRSALRQATQSAALVAAEGPNNQKLYTINPSFREVENED